MASAKQLKALLKSYADGDEAQFYSVAMQVAAHEAKLGHGNLARELRDLIDTAKTLKSTATKTPIPLVKPRGELSGLLSASYPKLKLVDMVLTSSVGGRLQRLIEEHIQIRKIRSHGFAPRKKLLLIGPPGTGKTMTASVLAGELGLPLFVVRFDSLITKFMGETAAKLRLIFDSIQQTRGIYLFDEFDSIGSQRGLGDDVGEIRRVLNCFLQMIESDHSDSILIAATNCVELLDYALFRRFDDVIEYQLPEKKEITAAFKFKLIGYASPRIQWLKVTDASKGLSYGDITKACENAIKDIVIHNKDCVAYTDLIRAIEEQQSVQRI